MDNPENPFDREPPSSAKLLRSTVLAALVAAVLLVTVVLPAEYGIDPTGVGAAIGLKRMGEIKTQLAAEAELDASATGGAEAAAGAAAAADYGVGVDDGNVVDGGSDVTPEASDDAWRDEFTVVLAPDEAVELKLVMAAGDIAEYSWEAEGGSLNFNKHGDGGGRSVEYEKGRGEPRRDGSLTAAFDGHHGWFWRNRSGNPVTLTLRTRGDYAELKRTM
jgi:hypothetical protein